MTDETDEKTFFLPDCTAVILVAHAVSFSFLYFCWCQPHVISQTDVCLLLRGYNALIRLKFRCNRRNAAMRPCEPQMLSWQ